MSKKPHTAETRIMPGAKKNLDVAAFGDISGDEYERARLVVNGLLHLETTENSIQKLPDLPGIRADNWRLLLQASLNFVTRAILENRPEDLRKLADVVEKTHAVRDTNPNGESRHRAVSPDLYAVETYRLLKREIDPSYEFTKAEIVAKVADAQGIAEIDRPANDALRKRAEAIIKALGIQLKDKTGK